MREIERGGGRDQHKFFGCMPGNLIMKILNYNFKSAVHSEELIGRELPGEGSMR